MEILPRVDLTRRKLDTRAMQRVQAASPADYTRVIRDSCLAFCDGKPVLLYTKLSPVEAAPIRAALQAIDYGQTYRTAGLKTQSRVIGFQPRVTVRRDYCTAAELAHRKPREHAALCGGAVLATSYMARYAPEVNAAQFRLLEEKVRPEWRIAGSAFTSGICNWNNPLRYHFDTGNFPGSWNAMLGFKCDIDGGYLALPEFDVALEVSDGSCAVFEAQNVLHGVTPFKKLSPRAYRYTIVYYALRGMCACMSAKEELDRIRTKKTERELKRRAQP